MRNPSKLLPVVLKKLNDKHRKQKEEKEMLKKQWENDRLSWHMEFLRHHCFKLSLEDKKAMKAFVASLNDVERLYIAVSISQKLARPMLKLRYANLSTC